MIHSVAETENSLSMICESHYIFKILDIYEACGPFRLVWLTLSAWALSSWLAFIFRYTLFMARTLFRANSVLGFTRDQAKAMGCGTGYVLVAVWACVVPMGHVTLKAFLVVDVATWYGFYALLI